ncbi:MAG: hypothetical protein ACREGE_04455 [Candidatus Microsaccharimonas sp.]
MKKALTLLFTLLSILIILDSLNAGHAVAMFLLAGVIPGTNLVLDATRTLELFLLLSGFTLSRIILNAVRIVIARRAQVATPALA